MVTIETIHAMRRYGGSFVNKLADLWDVCDQTNRTILENAYWSVFERYEQMSKEVTQ